MSELSDAIAAAATSPKSVVSDATSVVARDLKDLIAADEHIANEEARQRSGFPLRIFHTRPPGTTGLSE